MSAIKSFRALVVWQNSMDLTVRCFGLARALPREEHAALGSELRRSAISIPSNVAEGFSRHSLASYINHLWVAHGSNAELETQLEITRRLELTRPEVSETLISDSQEIARMINGLVRALERGR